MMLVAGASAADFSAVAPNGQTLYYNYVSGGVELTYPSNTNIITNGWFGYTLPTGAVVVPEWVSDGTSSYHVVSVHNGALYECTGITSLTLPDGVVSIGLSAFNGCTQLAQLSLPASLTTISGAAFYNCMSLSYVTCYATVPPTATPTAFQNVPVGNCILEVPCASVEAYSSASVWGSFDSIVGGTCLVTLTTSCNNPSRGSVSGAGQYPPGTTVMLTATPANGSFFACWNDGDTLNPRVVTLTEDLTLTAWFFALQRDTMSIVFVHDTTQITIFLWDTLLVHDTVAYTVYATDTFYVHDTVAYYVDGTDTLYIHDTLTVHDTILPTFFRLHVEATEGGVGVGNCVLPAGTQAEIAALPLQGFRFARWNDGNTDNPRRVTLTSEVTYTADMEIVTAIDEVVGASWSMTVDGHMLNVECPVGSTVGIYSTDGRRLMQQTATDGRLRVWMPAEGVYLVQVDAQPARKVLITK